MNTTNEELILSEAVEILKEDLKPHKIILFGSRAKGNNSAGADFDLAVDAAKPGSMIQHHLSDRLESISGLYTIDVVYLNSVDDEFKNIVLESGKVIYEQ